MSLALKMQWLFLILMALSLGCSARANQLEGALQANPAPCSEAFDTISRQGNVQVIVQSAPAKNLFGRWSAWIFGRSSREESRLSSREVKAQRARLLSLLPKDNSPQGASRRALIENSEVVSVDWGGFGVTFSVREPNGEKIRYKALLHSVTDASEHPLEREAAFAMKAGEAGIGPWARLDLATDLLKMKEIEGKNLADFSVGELNMMNEPEREAWLENFTVALSESLQKLHALGIVHLDLKPENIMIPTENENGKKIFLIDYGISLNVSELPKIHRELRGKSYDGTRKFQGVFSMQGRPGIPDDLDSAQLLMNEVIMDGRKLATPIEKQGFLKKRPRLRAVLTLLGYPIRSEANASWIDPTEYNLLANAAKEKLSPEEENSFWKGFITRLERRSSNQFLNIFFSDPLFRSEEGFLKHYHSSQLAHLLDAGMREQNWVFDSRASEGVRLANGWFLPRSLFFWRKKEPVGFPELYRFRESLGPIPADLKAAGM